MSWLDHPPKRRRTRRQEERLQMVRYGVGMWCGFMAVHFAKKLVKRVPVVGWVIKPFTDLVPSHIVGPALGAAVVFTMDEADGDVHVAKHKMKRIAKDAHREIEETARDMHHELRHALKRHETAARQTLLPALQEQVSQVERTITPAIEREYKALQRELERFQRERAVQQQLIRGN